MTCVKKQCVQIEKNLGEHIRQFLLLHNLLDNSVRIASDKNYIYLPLVSNSNTLLDGLIIAQHDFKVNRKTATLKDMVGFTPSYEIIGNLAILEDNKDIEKTAEALMILNPYLKTVLLTDSPVEGEFRTRKFKVIKGELSTATIFKEYGCSYRIDMEKAYFTPRLGTERARILQQVINGQTVIDMFAGVGPFSILIAKNNPKSKIISIDKNPEAINLLKHNISLNKIQNIIPIEGDVRDAILPFAHSADHIIMNLPHNAHEFLDFALIGAKIGTMIHFYDIAHENNLYEKTLENIKEAIKKSDFEITNIQKRIVRSYAPHQFNVCVEVELNCKGQ